MTSQVYVNNTTLSDAAEFNRFDTAAYPALSSVAGTNTITATGPANYSLIATWPALWFIPANTNTGATTLAITPTGSAALTAKNVFSRGVACVGGEIRANVPCFVVYDGTQYNILNPQVVRGTTTNDSAAAGVVGEYVSASILLGGAVSVTPTGTFVNVTSISLTAGDWDVTGEVTVAQNGSTITAAQMAVSANSGNTTTDHINGDNQRDGPPPTNLYSTHVTVAAWRQSLSATTTIYLKASASFSAGTPVAFGRISARRVR